MAIIELGRPKAPFLPSPKLNTEVLMYLRVNPSSKRLSLLFFFFTIFSIILIIIITYHRLVVTSEGSVYISISMLCSVRVFHLTRPVSKSDFPDLHLFFLCFFFINSTQ